MLFGSFAVHNSDEVTAQGDTILNVGCQDEPKTRNLLATIDVWTHNVLDPVFDSVTKLDPETEEVKPYILKGTDANENGVFDDNEYGVFTSFPSKPLEVTAFYDFNGVLFHDGYQATVNDLLFSYHLDAMNPKAIELDVLKDKNNLPGSNYSATKWLHLNELSGFSPASDWSINKPHYSDPGYNTSLRAAVHFTQQAPYWDFFRSTLSRTLHPAYLWQGTGCIYDSTLQSFECQIHKYQIGTLMESFGMAYDPLTGNGVPPSDQDAFDYNLAESWDIPDEYVIGTGPFTFDRWVPGQFTSLDRNDEYYVGEPYLHLPYIEGMLFKVFKTTQTAIFALRSGYIDCIAWSIPPAFVPELVDDPNISIVSTMPEGFTYLTYNMRGEPFGYQGGDPTWPDVGKNFRQAVAHLIDKKTIVNALLQNYGIIGDGPVSPVLTKWYNTSLPLFQYDPIAADALLDYYDPWDVSVDGPCTNANPSNCRTFPVIGNSLVQVITPNADYDPIRAATGTLISQAMNDVGINTRSTPMAMAELETKIENRDFQMALLNRRINRDPPEFLHSLFYSRNSAQGDNSPGYQSDEFDQLSLMARQELDVPTQVDLVKQSQGVIAFDRPYDVVYFPTVIEAYRSDNFVNWTVGSQESIYNYWSWLGIHEPLSDSLRVITSIQTDVSTDNTAGFTATVTDADGRVISDSTVNVYVNPIDGEFLLGPQKSNLVSGMTDQSGEIYVTYVPPVLAKNDTTRTVFIHAWATHPEHNESRNATDTIRVHPPGDTFLSLLVDLQGGDYVLEGGSAAIGIQVVDGEDNPVLGASVTVDSNPPVIINPGSGITDNNGFIDGSPNVIFNAPPVVQDTYHLISILAVKTDHRSAQESLILIVINNLRPEVEITSLSSGQTISGVAVISGTAHDPDGDNQLDMVEVDIDGAGWEVVSGTTSWSFTLDTKNMSEDSHTISARSFDGAEYSLPASVIVYVDNNEPPVVSVPISPGQEFSGEVNIVGDANDQDGNDEIIRVEVRIDNGNWKNATGTSRWSFLLDTRDLENGNHTLLLRAYDGTEYSTTLEIPFTVYNEEITDCPDGTECGGILPIIGWLGLIALIAVLLVASIIVLARSRRRTESDESPEEAESSEEPTISTPEEERKD
jgi:ABC-type transport system substrate-binding protein